MIDETFLSRLLLVAQEAARPTPFELDNLSIYPGKIPIMAVPKGAAGTELKSLKPFLEEWRQYPERIKGTTTALTLDSFCALVDRHRSADSVLFADVKGRTPSLTAFIDYHTVLGADGVVAANQPRNLDQRIVYAWPASREWTVWHSKDGEEHGQAGWAQFLEDRLPDIASPTDEERAEYEGRFLTRIATPAELLTLSRGLTVAAESKVKEIRNLQTGEASVSFEETHRDATGAPLVVPGLFMIQIPLFEGAVYSRVLVRLRYRRKDSGLLWHFRLYRAQEEREARMEQDSADAAAHTNLPLFHARLG